MNVRRKEAVFLAVIGRTSLCTPWVSVPISGGQTCDSSPISTSGSAEQWDAQMMREHKMAQCEGMSVGRVSVGRKIEASLGYSVSEIKENKEEQDKIITFSWQN